MKPKRETKSGEESTHFNGSFGAKYILFEPKKYRGIIFHETKEGNKIWKGIDLSFQN